MSIKYRVMVNKYIKMVIFTKETLKITKNMAMDFSLFQMVNSIEGISNMIK